MTEESVTQIGLKCGFENLSYFNRLFRRKFGVTPGQYQGRERGNSQTVGSSPNARRESRQTHEQINVVEKTECMLDVVAV